LHQTDPRLIRRHCGVVGERIVWELRGRSCLPLEAVAPPRQQVMVSRSFGAPVNDLAELCAAVTAFATRAVLGFGGPGLAPVRAHHTQRPARRSSLIQLAPHS
jgi:DNA polymerase V